MTDVIFLAIFVVFFALMVALVRFCESIVGKDDAVDPAPTPESDTGTDTDHRRRGGTGMKSYDNLVGLIISILVTAYLIYALVAPEKL